MSNDSHIWHFTGLTLLILLTYLQKKAERSSIYLIIWHFAGTILHELMHFLISFFLNGKPLFPSVIPRKISHRNESDGTTVTCWQLGSLISRNVTPFNALPIGFAPLLLVFVGFFIYLNWFIWFDNNFVNTIFFYLTMYVLIYSALPSTQDIKIAFSSIVGVIIWFFLFLTIWKFHEEIILILQYIFFWVKFIWKS